MRTLSRDFPTARSSFSFRPCPGWQLGWRKPDSITVEIQKPLNKRGIDFVHGSALAIDTAAQHVVSSVGNIPYDYLLIATGSDLDSTVPGLDPAPGMCSTIFTLDGALLAQSKLDAALQGGRGSIVIGSAQGASCLGPAYELIGMIDTQLRRWKKRRHFDLHFITPEPFLGHFGI
jgi:sulfide:quinone oxidoreductase